MTEKEQQDACYLALRRLYQGFRRLLTKNALSGQQRIDIIEMDRIWKLCESGAVFQRYDQKALEGIEALLKLLPTEAEVEHDLEAMQQFRVVDNELKPSTKVEGFSPTPRTGQ